MEKFKKIKEVYSSRGFVSVIAGGLFSVLRLLSDPYRNIKERSKVQKISKFNSKGIFKVNNYIMSLDPNKTGIHSELIQEGIREIQATEEMESVIRKGDVILEAGANIGYYALLESQRVGNDGKIYAIEPTKTNFRYLKKNINLNRAKNIESYKLALGDKDGQTFINIYDAENWNTIADIPYAQKRSREKVTLKKVDTFLRDKRKPTFVRMDVEGFEYEIINGMEGLLKKSPPRGMFIEMHFYIMGEDKSISLLKKLKERGYEIKRYFVDKKPCPRIRGVDWMLQRLERIKDKQKIIYGEVKGVKIDDLLKNKDNLRSGAPEIFFELKNVEKRI